ncbi:hypothetical protein HME9304_00262 [Flagellimonas maritima]|uniref:Type II secretion system protein GspC N-terminal domain-containing protein n=1 Tax=Flagellimonas maritima TaxID=1383885 RepID=A0A2Z4LN57_9FLAO|nr:hypothetical protein [Allomuricauda aurantiaca]AWX43275.1 hypothetical protein HME9304_00262 [Allomuricauda aurantiaca]
MSKNIKTYLLLAIVLVVWGIIGLRILDVFSKEQEAPTFAERPNFKPKEIMEKDTFNIVADYRDPFLGTLSASLKKTNNVVKFKTPTVEFPSIIYTGLITDQQTNAHIFFVTIAGSPYLMQKKGRENGVTLLSGNSKHIKVRFKGTLKTIPLQSAIQN